MTSPIAPLAIVVITLAFMTVMFGSDIAEMSFPFGDEPDAPGQVGDVEDEATGLRAVAQAIQNFVSATVRVFTLTWGAVIFFFNLVTFNVPGAPTFVRFVVGSIIGGNIVWAVAGLIRGGK